MNPHLDHAMRAVVLVALLTPPPPRFPGSIRPSTTITITTGTVINVPGPPSTARDSDTVGNSVESVRSLMESHKGPGSVYDTIRNNYPTN